MRANLALDRGRSTPLQLAGRPEAAPVAFLVLLAVLLSLTTPGFASPDNLVSIVNQVAVVGIVALAVNQVILAGEIDVSTGSLLAACAFVYGNVAIVVGGAILPLLAALAAGGAVGLLNGVLVTVGRVPSIITTLGMLLLLRGTVLLAAANGVLGVPDPSRFFGLAQVAHVRIPPLILLIVFALFTLLSRNTTWGRDVLAIGSNARAARAVGLRVGLVRLWCFIASGLACGLASAVFIGQNGQLQATAATGFELRVIAAVVLGGTSITGGRGSVIAPVLGAILVGVILNALTLNSVPVTFEQLVLGALILAAIMIDAFRSRLSGRQ